MSDREADVVRSLFSFLKPSWLTHGEWMRSGMVAKDAGLILGEWDEWSSPDPRYKPGECERRWRSFKPGGGVGVGTLFEIAKKYGWQGEGRRPQEDARSAANANQENRHRNGTSHVRFLPEPKDPAEPLPDPGPQDPTQQAAVYIAALFRPGERACVVTAAKPDGSPADAGSIYEVDMVSGLLQGGTSLEVVFGQFDPKGAWIRVNPCTGPKNDDVTAYRSALIECDDIPVEDQWRIISDLRLPCRAITHSGNKSLHAVVDIGAHSRKEYDERVRELYDICIANGLPVDPACKNPSRLTRLPGVMRGDREQTLIATGVGAESWAGWMEFVKTSERETRRRMPPIENVGDLLSGGRPEQDPVLIEGVVRTGRKMLVTGPSKAGKTTLLIELALALANGGPWLGRKCKKTSVLYVNLEVEEKVMTNRFASVAEALPWAQSDSFGDIDVWNLRGKAGDLDEIARSLEEDAGPRAYGAIIIDPAYKVEGGDENSAHDMALFTQKLDAICESTGATVIYAHHHSKGQQGAKSSMDRGSGSGVFARDADALLDLTPLEPDEKGVEWLASLGEGATAHQLSMTLREFRIPQPANLAFAYPRHIMDDEGNLSKSAPVGSAAQRRAKGSRTTKERAEEKRRHRDESIRRAIEQCAADGAKPSSREVHERFCRISHTEVQLATFRKWLNPSCGDCPFHIEDEIVVPD